MKMQSVNPMYAAQSANPVSFKAINLNKRDCNGINGEILDVKGDKGNFEKDFGYAHSIGLEGKCSSFQLQPGSGEYGNLKILFSEESSLKGDGYELSVKKQEAAPAFKGHLYGSISKKEGEEADKVMKSRYQQFLKKSPVASEYKAPSMAHAAANHSVENKNRQYLESKGIDCNFFIPTDGDGTRYKDVSMLQDANLRKPATKLPATLNGEQMYLAQGVMSNFAQTGMLTNGIDNGFTPVEVEPAQGSAYALLEGLKDGTVPTDKPLVFAWGDNFSDIDISRLVANHDKNGAGFTMTVVKKETDKDNISALSVIKVDENNPKKIVQFTEKPKQNDIDDCKLPDSVTDIGKKDENTRLAGVGPYVISPEALQWIKEGYSENPASFKDDTKGFDFSSKIIAPLLNAMNNGEITNADGEKMPMCYEVVQDNETWSDLGGRKDFKDAIHGVKEGTKFVGLPAEIIDSMKQCVDDNGNISLGGEKTMKQFHKMCDEKGIVAHNVIIESTDSYAA